jgi:hypothetical protein
MAAKPKTRGSGAKKKAPSKEQKEQSERFIETARKLGTDESGKSFDAAVSVLLRSSRAVKK